MSKKFGEVFPFLSHQSDLSMKQGYFTLILFLLLACSTLHAQVPLEKMLFENGKGYTITKGIGTADGGLIVVGHAYENLEDTKSRRNGLVIKLNADIEIEWTYTFGGDGNDWFDNVFELKDGQGFLITGLSASESENFYGFAFTNTSDVWCVKLDTQGQEQWSRIFKRNYSRQKKKPSPSEARNPGLNFGTPDISHITGVIEEDNEYLLIGLYIDPSPPAYKRWLCSARITKKDGTDTGYVVYDKTEALELSNTQYAVHAKTDIVVLNSIVEKKLTSTVAFDKLNGKTNYHLRDAYIRRVIFDRNYTQMIVDTIGGPLVEMVSAVVQFPDGGYTIFGNCSSENDAFPNYKGGLDVLFMHFDHKGNLKNQTCIGSAAHNSTFYAVSYQNGYALVQYNWPIKDDIKRKDFVLQLVILDASGRVQKTLPFPKGTFELCSSGDNLYVLTNKEGGTWVTYINTGQ